MTDAQSLYVRLVQERETLKAKLRGVEAELELIRESISTRLADKYHAQIEREDKP